MRAQSAVIGVMLFFVSMIIMGAMFLGIVSKTIKLLDAGRMEIEFLTRKAQERIEVGWKFEPAGGDMYYPVLVINNTGPVLVDSLFVKCPRDTSCEEIRDMVVKATDFKAKVEADYKWLYIPLTKKGLGAANRYYGALRNGDVKIKGIMVARKDTPPIIREAQEEAIRILSRADDPTMFRDILREACHVFDEYAEKIRNGDVEAWQLVIRRRITRPSQKPSTQTGSITVLMTGQAMETAYIVGPGRKAHPHARVQGII